MKSALKAKYDVDGFPVVDYASEHFYHDKKLVFIGVVYDTKLKKGDVVPMANFYCIRCNKLFHVVTSWESESDHKQVIELLKLGGMTTS